MDYISTHEAAEKWGVSLRQVQRLLRSNRIDGARKYGISWMIPADAEKPTLSMQERKAVKAHKGPALSGQSSAGFPLLHIHGGNLTGAYKRCQSSDERALLDAWLVLYRGDAPAAGQAAAGILAETRKPLIKLGCGILLSSAAMHEGNPAAWRAAVEELQATRVPTDLTQEHELAVAAAKAGLHGRDVYPAWLESGALSALSPELLPAAYQVYVLILYAKYKELDLLAVVEPLLAACRKEQSDISEIYLHLLAATAYHNKGGKTHAREHMAQAVELAKPLGAIAPFVEYRHMAAEPMDGCLQEKWPEMLPEIKRRMHPFMTNWARVYTDVWGKPFTTTLTQREYEVALLASRGLSVIDIAERVCLSQNSIKKYLSATYAKLGVKKKRELRPFFHHP